MARRRYADLEPRPEEELETAEEIVPELPEPAARDPRLARMVALQRGAGNAATGRVLARDPAANPVLELQNRKWAVMDQAARTVLKRLNTGEGTRESLAEVTLQVHEELKRMSLGTAMRGERTDHYAVTVEEIQAQVLIVARQEHMIIPGHRRLDDQKGIEAEAKAAAGLSGVKLPEAAIKATAAGFEFTFDGDIAVSGKIGNTPVEAKGGPEGGEARVGPVTAGVNVSKKGPSADIKVVSGPLELVGKMGAVGDRVTWSVDLKIKFAGGAAAVPDPAELAKLIETTGSNLTSAAEYIGSAVTGRAQIDKPGFEDKLKPAGESMGKVANYVEKHKGGKAGSTSATLGVTAGTDDKGVTSVMFALKVPF